MSEISGIMEMAETLNSGNVEDQGRWVPVSPSVWRHMAGSGQCCQHCGTYIGDEPENVNLCRRCFRGPEPAEGWAETAALVMRRQIEAEVARGVIFDSFH